MFCTSRRKQCIRGPLVRRFAISTVLLLGLLFSNSAFADAGGKRANEIGSMGPVPKAQCGPSDRTESGLQGQTTSEERASGDSGLRYNCNLELVGQFRGRGPFRRTDRHTLITASTWRQKITRGRPVQVRFL